TNDFNGAGDVFVRDTVLSKTMLVSVNLSGQSGNGDSSVAVMTPDGRFVTFVSSATDLVPNDTNGIPDVFLRDLQGGTTTLVSANAQPDPLYSGISDSPSITPNGRFVAFASSALNLVQAPGATNVAGDVYVRDLSAGVTLWASKDITGFLGPRAKSFA